MKIGSAGFVRRLSGMVQFVVGKAVITCETDLCYSMGNVINGLEWSKMLNGLDAVLIISGAGGGAGGAAGGGAGGARRKVI